MTKVCRVCEGVIPSTKGGKRGNAVYCSRECRLLSTKIRARVAARLLREHKATLAAEEEAADG